MQTFDLPPTTHALQLVRCGKEEFVYYEAVTFPDSPRAICDMYLRRAAICGKIGDGVSSPYTVDLLNEDGDTLVELPIERKAARYLVEKLKLRVRRD